MAILCPNCDSDLDIEPDTYDDGEVICCGECGEEFEVVIDEDDNVKVIPVDVEVDATDNDEDEND